MFQKELFKGKVALVTGGGSGIGYAIARQLLQFGATVYVASRKEDRLQEAVATLREAGPCDYLICNIREPEQRVLGMCRVDEQKADKKE